MFWLTVHWSLMLLFHLFGIVAAVHTFATGFTQFGLDLGVFVYPVWFIIYLVLVSIVSGGGEKLGFSWFVDLSC